MKLVSYLFFFFFKSIFLQRKKTNREKRQSWPLQRALELKDWWIFQGLWVIFDCEPLGMNFWYSQFFLFSGSYEPENFKTSGNFEKVILVLFIGNFLSWAADSVIKKACCHTESWRKSLKCQLGLHFCHFFGFKYSYRYEFTSKTCISLQIIKGGINTFLTGPMSSKW